MANVSTLLDAQIREDERRLKTGHESDISSATGLNEGLHKRRTPIIKKRLENLKRYIKENNISLVVCCKNYGFKLEAEKSFYKDFFGPLNVTISSNGKDINDDNYFNILALAFTILLFGGFLMVKVLF